MRHSEQLRRRIQKCGRRIAHPHNDSQLRRRFRQRRPREPHLKRPILSDGTAVQNAAVRLIDQHDRYTGSGIPHHENLCRSHPDAVNDRLNDQPFLQPCDGKIDPQSARAVPERLRAIREIVGRGGEQGTDIGGAQRQIQRAQQRGLRR